VGHKRTRSARHLLLPSTLVLARLVVGGVFLIAAIDKLQSPGAFSDAIRAFHLLPPQLVLPVAFALPWLELLVSAYLLSGFLTRLGATGAILLLLTFVFALGSSLASGNTNHACGCFGTGDRANPVLAFISGGSTITWWDLIRDFLLVMLSAVILFAGPGRLSLDAMIASFRRS
jgi:uncharacterized membrane protein YphA (DoxX/SURF4 family)